MKKLIIGTLIIATSIATHAQEKRHAGAHVHGLNKVKMILSQNQLSVIYQMPMVQLSAEAGDDNHNHHDDEHKGEGVFAFLKNMFSHDDHEEEHHDHDKEHEEHHHEKKHEHDQATHAHDEGHDNVKEPENLAKKMQKLKDYTKLFALPTAAQCNLVDFQPELHSVSSESSHKDVELNYAFNCKQPTKIDAIDFKAFKHFELDVVMFDAIINNKTISKKVDADHSKVAL